MRFRLIAAALLIANSAFAQFIDPPYSMGQPQRLRPYVGWQILNHGYIPDFTGAYALLGLQRPILAPQLNALSAEVEGQAGFDRTTRGMGGSVSLGLRIISMAGGARYDVVSGDTMPYFSFQAPLRRGGLFGISDQLRVDWLPTRRLWSVGGSYLIGPSSSRRARPVVAHVDLEDAARFRPLQGYTVNEVALERLRHSMEWLDQLLTPYITSNKLSNDADMERYAASLKRIKDHVAQPGHTFLGEDAAFHAAMEDAFGSAAGDEAKGPALASLARIALLNDVIAKFNQHMGREKKPHLPSAFLRAAHEHFAEDITAPEFGFDAKTRGSVVATMDRILSYLADVADAQKDRWKDSRFTWLPLNYAVTQADMARPDFVNKVLESLTSQPFTQTNKIAYILNEQWFFELKRMLRDTRRYHVLWIHDFKGQNPLGGRPDHIGWDVAIDGYMAAMTQAVKDLDAGRRDVLPQYLMFLDQHFYESVKSRGIITFLERIYDGEDHLPDHRESRMVREKLRTAHRELRDAIAASTKLRGLSRKELRAHFKVHVNITNPYDPGYVKYGFVPDNILRDHRKISFRDVFEEDPSSGVAIFTGQGVGENYIGPKWEDRSMMIQGEALAGLKDAARELFMSQGNREFQIPVYLRARERTERTDEILRRLRDEGWRTPVQMAMNHTGYAKKQSTVVKAALYNLMQPGSILIAPDSLWLSDFWAAMMINAALRGVKVYPVAPSYSNAPSAAPFTMGVLHEMMSKMQLASTYLAPEIEKAGGKLRVGLYSLGVSAIDPRKRLELFLKTAEDRGTVDPIFALDTEVLRTLRAIYDSLGTVQPYPLPGGLEMSEANESPDLHLKAQFFATAQGMAVIQRPEWKEVLLNYFKIRGMQVTMGPNNTERLTPESLGLSVLRDAHVAEHGEMAQFRMIIGSHNQDRRGMIQDGEVTISLQGYDTLVSLIDFVFLVGTSDWPMTQEEIDAAFPKAKPFWKTFGRLIRNQL